MVRLLPLNANSISRPPCAVMRCAKRTAPSCHIIIGTAHIAPAVCRVSAAYSKHHGGARVSRGKCGAISKRQFTCTSRLGSDIHHLPHPHRIYQEPLGMSEQPQSLRALFLKAEQARKELASSYETNSPAFQENLRATIATYEECIKVVAQVSLFSPNESLEDISSSDLQYVPRVLHSSAKNS